MATRWTGSGFEIRGLMLDPGRLVERHDFYFNLLPDLARWGYNTLWWHFCDDEGFALKLKSHPELATPFAFSRAETRRLVEAARQHGIEVIPEVESLGHTLSITRLPRYAHLFNGRPFGHNAICPSHPDTLPLLRDIFAEAAGLFDSPYLHAGLDESDLSGCPRCARRGRGRPEWWVLAEHILAVHRIVTGLGKRMVMWADSVEKHPAMLKVLPRDIVMLHWHYGAVPAEKILPSARAGFQVLCAPAISGVVLQPHAAAFRNVADNVAMAGRLPRKAGLGVVTCWWESARNLRDTYPLAAAYAGAAMRGRRAPEPRSFARRFCREYFGLRDAAAADALWRLHELVPDRGQMKFLYPDSLPDVHEGLNVAAESGFDARAVEAAQALEILHRARGKVIRHRAEFDAYLLAGRITADAYENGRALRELNRCYARALGLAEYKAPRTLVQAELAPALPRLEARAKEIVALTEAAAREWDRTRHPRDRKKDNSSPLVRQRGTRFILATLLRAAAFARQGVSLLRRTLRHPTF
jgi:hypothetical protein